MPNARICKSKTGEGTRRAISSSLLISLIAFGIIIPWVAVMSYYARIQPLNNNINVSANPHASTLAAIIPFPATAFAYNQYSRVIYAIGSASSDAHSLLEINATSNKVIGQIMLPFDEKASGIGFDAANRDLYVILDPAGSLESSSTSQNTTLIALNTVSNKIDMNYSLDAFQIAVDPLRNRIFAAVEWTSGRNETVLAGVSIIDGGTNKITKNITFFESEAGKCCFEGQLMYDPITNYLYQSVGTFGTTTNDALTPFAVALDLTRGIVFTNLSPLSGTSNFAYDPHTGLALASSNGFYNASGGYNSTFIDGGHNITLFNGSRSVRTFSVGSDPRNPDESIGAIAYDPSSQRIYAAFGTIGAQDGYRAVEDKVATINATSEKTILVSPDPDGVIALFVDPVNLDLYISTPSFTYADIIS